MVVQHTPVMSARDETSIVSHDLLAELLEEFSLPRFGKIICNHFLCGQVFNHNVALLHLVCDKEIEC